MCLDNNALAYDWDLDSNWVFLSKQLKRGIFHAEIECLKEFMRFVKKSGELKGTVLVGFWFCWKLSCELNVK